MKKLLSLIAISFIFFPVYIFAQMDETCGTQVLDRESLDLTQEGGIYLTLQWKL